MLAHNRTDNIKYQSGRITTSTNSTNLMWNLRRELTKTNLSERWKKVTDTATLVRTNIEKPVNSTARSRRAVKGAKVTPYPTL